MSNHDINLAVGMKLDIGDVELYGLASGVWSYTDEWNHVMPIAEKNDFNMRFIDGFVEFDNDVDKAISSVNKNYKRAICEVFLMMDAKQ